MAAVRTDKGLPESLQRDLDAYLGGQMVFTNAADITAEYDDLFNRVASEVMHINAISVLTKTADALFDARANYLQALHT